jgi:RNA-dependent RNA polymerase
MTDGCGLINGSALSLIWQRLCLDCRPSAVQGRIAGSKGVWILHPTDREQSEPPRIWIRDSQRKIKFHSLDDRANRVFNYVAPARLTPYRMSKQSIINLSHNNVDDEVFKTLLRDALSVEVKKVTDWASPYAMHTLWRVLHQSGVGQSRFRRQAQGVARALGLAGRELPGPIAMWSDVQHKPQEVCTGRNPYSGAPLSLHESAMEMIQAGFHPYTSKILYEKLQRVLKLVVDSHVKEFRINVPQAAAVFIVPGRVLQAI